MLILVFFAIEIWVFDVFFAWKLPKMLRFQDLVLRSVDVNAVDCEALSFGSFFFLIKSFFGHQTGI